MPRYWFRQKQFGYGATPNTWQGWIFSISGTLLIAALALGAEFVRDNGVRLVIIIVGVPLVLIPFLLVAYAKTEGGWRWRWGQKN